METHLPSTKVLAGQHRDFVKNDSLSHNDAHVSVLLLSTFVSSLPSLSDGYNLAVINNSRNAVETWFLSEGRPLTVEQWSYVVSNIMLAAMLSSLFVGPLLRRFGPRTTMMLNDACYLASALMLYFAHTYGMLLAGRALAGLALGLNMPCVQIFIQECAPTEIRGRLGTIPLIGSGVTIILGFVLGMHSVLGTSSRWHLLYLLSGVPAALHLCTAWLLPESPRWYVLMGRVEEARTALLRLRGRTNGEAVEVELAALQASVDSVQQTSFVSSLWELASTRAYVRPLILGNVLPVLIQFTCGNFLPYYSKSLFVSVGLHNGELATVLVGVVCLLSMMSVGYFIEKVGRRGILLYGWGATAVLAALSSVSAMNSHSPVWNKIGLVMILLYTFIGTAPASIAFMIAPELFPTHVRAAAVSLCGLTARASGFFMGRFFLNFLQIFGDKIFFFFAGMCVLSVLFVMFLLPETKGVALEDIGALFERETTAAGVKNERVGQVVNIGMDKESETEVVVAVTESTRCDGGLKVDKDVNCRKTAGTIF